MKSLGGATKTKKALNKWSVRRLTQADIENVSESSEGSVDSEPAKEADLPQFDDQGYEGCEENGEVATMVRSLLPFTTSLLLEVSIVLSPSIYEWIQVLKSILLRLHRVLLILHWFYVWTPVPIKRLWPLYSNTNPINVHVYLKLCNTKIVFTTNH